jgi:aspartate aminotransferase-like enzyme
MATPMVDHRGKAFADVLHAIATRMKPIFGTQGEVLVLGGSGTGGLEAAVANMFGPGDYLVACPVGVFGERLIAIAKTYGCEVEVLDTTWGHGVDPAKLRARLEADTEKKITGILLTHNETSTGVQNVMGPLADATRAHGAYVVVDSVSGLGASEFTMDAWGFDVVVTASQKALAVPPGLAMVAVSERAWAKMERNPSPRYYFDLKKAREFAGLGQTPWTPPVSIAFATEVALDAYEREGAHAFWARHDRYARAYRAAAAAMHLEVFSQDGAHSVTVTAIKVPDGIDGPAIQKRLREQFGFTIGGGQKELKGKLLRLGTMGALAPSDLLAMLAELERALFDAGHPVHLGAAENAAREILEGVPA